MMTSVDIQEMLVDYKDYYNYIKARRELRELGKAFDDRDYLKEKVMNFANKHIRVDDLGTAWKDVMFLKKSRNYNPNRDRGCFQVFLKNKTDYYSRELTEEELISGFMFLVTKINKNLDTDIVVNGRTEHVQTEFEYKFKYAESFHSRIMDNPYLKINGELNIQKLEMIFGDLYDKDIGETGYKDAKTEKERINYFYKELAHIYFFVPSRKPGEERLNIPYLSGVPELMALLETKIRQNEFTLDMIFRDASDIEKIKNMARGSKERDRDFNIGF